MYSDYILMEHIRRFNLRSALHARVHNGNVLFSRGSALSELTRLFHGTGVRGRIMRNNSDKVARK